MNALKRHIFALPKHLLRLSLVGFVLIVLIWFGLQAFALRDPERYRPQLVDMFQQTTGLSITIGSIDHAPWRVQPGVLLNNIVIYNEQKQPILTVPKLEARLSLINLFRARLDFSRLKITIDEISVKRDEQGQWYLASLLIPKSDTNKNPFLHWLIQQGHCNLTINKLIFSDQFIHSPNYIFHHVALELNNSGSRHFVKGSLIPDRIFGDMMSFEGDIYGSQSDNLSTWQGNVKWLTNRFNLTSLSPWFNQLKPIESGYGSVNAILMMHNNLQFGIEADIDLHNIQGRLINALSNINVGEIQGHVGFNQLTNGFEVNTKQLMVGGSSTIKLTRPLNMYVMLSDKQNVVTANQLVMDDIHNNLDQIPLTESQRQFWYKLGLQGEIDNLNANWQGNPSNNGQYQASFDLHQFASNPYQLAPAIHDFTGHVDLRDDGGRVKGQGTSLTLNYPTVFSQPIYLDKYAIDTNWIRHAENIALNLNEISLSNNDMAGSFSGNMNLSQNGPGKTQLQGSLQRADISTVWRYMPLTVNQEARDWLKQGLVRGLAKEISFKIDGDLQHFPFVNDQDGVFQVNAKVFDALVNFNSKWPVIDHVGGDFYMRGPSLGFKANTGLILNNQLKEVTLTIADLVHSNEILQVDGKTQSSVKDTLEFIRKSPISEHIHHVTDQLTGAGNGLLSLKMTIPLSHTIDTTLKGDYQFIDAVLDDGKKGIPPINALNGHLYFTETGVSSDELKATVLGGPAQLIFTTNQDHATVLKAQGRADASTLYGVYGNTFLKNVSGQSDWTAAITFTANKTDVLLDSKALLVNEPVNIHLSTRPDGLIDLALNGNTSIKGLTILFPNPMLSSLDSSVDWNGHVILSQKNDQVSFSLAALVLKKPVTMTVKGSLSHLLVADLSGHTDIASLSRLGMQKLQNISEGGFDWHARFEKRQQQTTITFTSNLKGTSILGPEPYQKTITQTLPLTVVIEPLESGRTAMSLNIDSWFGVKVFYESKNDGSFNATRGVINMGGPYLGQVGPGFSLTGRLDNSNLDELISYWNQHQNQWQTDSGITKTNSSSSKNNLFGEISAIDLNINKVIWRNREWLAHHLRANWQDPQWSIALRGEQLNGSINWIKEGKGAVKAVFTQLVVPDTIKKKDSTTDGTDTTKPHKKHRSTDLSTLKDLTKMPDIELSADHCQFGKKSFSHLEFSAKGQDNIWHINRLLALAEGGELRGNGQWTGTVDQETKTELTVEIEAKNLGEFLTALGYDKLMSRGDGKIRANLSWMGGPKDYDFDYSSGTMNLDLQDGQFSKVDPGGAGRIIGLLSLQSLPRRITLNFHDIFSQGFAFDTVKGDFSIHEGVLSTPDFVMSGPAARVKLTGQIDVPNETSDLIAKVDPAVGGDLSLAGTLIGGPVVGAATYLVQKILRNPLDKVLSYQYRIRGDWDNPQIDSVNGDTVN
jgi:uncharacterized protein YhdP